MKTELRNLRFEIDKHRGWPKLHDDGLADLRFAGRGMSITMNLAAAVGGQKGERKSTKEARMFLDPRYVRVKIDRLALSMHDTRRDWMYKLMSPFVAARVKRAIERSIRDQIVSTIRFIDSMTKGLSSGIFSV